MNILYLTNLSGSLWNGPNNSVPAQIKAQSELDNVFWFNYSHAKREEWTQIARFQNLCDISNPCLNSFPEPFNTPDIVVIEEFYDFPFNKLIKEIQKKNIPYVIIPRSQMTALAQKQKFLKKKIGNILFFNKMVKRASAIEYLTENEKKDSISQWKKNNFVIPNGILMPMVHEKNFSKGCINATYIGRVDIYQKGLDILLESISEIKKSLEEKRFSLTIYGPSQANDLNLLKRMVSRLQINKFVQFKSAVFGEEKQKVLLSTDVFIMTSRFEGLPMGLIEALSYGVPCFVTRGTNMAEEINEADAGWIAENNKKSVCESFLQMLAFNNYSSKGKKAYQLAKKYSWEEIAKRTHDEYVNIIRQ